MNYRRSTSLMLYYLIASSLPNSWFPMGKIYNRIRQIILGKIIVLGRNCRIQRHVYIGNGEEIRIGDNCQINERVRMDNVHIGNHVMIAREVVFLGKTHNSESTELSMAEQGIKDDFLTVVEDDVWLGMRSIIMPGIRVGRGSIVASGAVVTKDVAPFTIVGGIPAKLIKNRGIE